MTKRCRILGALVTVAVFPYLGCNATTDLNCLIQGDNVSGHVIFSQNVTMQKGSLIRIEYSTDNFATVGGQKTVTNSQGLLAVPYSLCAPTDTAFILRAYQDTDGNGKLGTGEGEGLDDGTSNGDATPIARTITGGTTWQALATDIALDTIH